MARVDHKLSACVFCRRSDVGHEAVGEKLRKNNISVHENCLYFSSGLSQQGESENDEENSIRGFLLRDIQREVKRGTLFRCVVCKQAGASVGCSIKSCRNVGHVPCLQTKNYLFQYFDCFAAFCPKHRPNQNALMMLVEPNISSQCCICLCEIQPDDDFIKLLCPSCLTLFHRECIQKQASTAGKYFFKCPVCNNKDDYTEEMLRMGISIPIRDAEWESSGQFQEDFEESKYCNAVYCLCPQGRSHHAQLGKYRMKKCQSCGQWLGHIHCLRNDHFLCSDCVLVQPPLLSSSSVVPVSSSLPMTVSTMTVHTHRTSISTTTLQVQTLHVKQDCSCAVCEARACTSVEMEEFGSGENINAPLITTTYSSCSPVEPTLRVSIPRCFVSLGQKQSHSSLVVSIPRPPLCYTPLLSTVHPKMIEFLQNCPYLKRVAKSVKVKRLNVHQIKTLYMSKSYN